MGGQKKQGSNKRQGSGGQREKGLSISQALKTLSQAAKKSRTFESQKIIRKLKKLKEEEGDEAELVKDLETQLEAVKTLDPSQAAASTLRSYCTKHDLAHLIPADLFESPKHESSTPTGKALNRVLANKHLHEAILAIAPKLAASASPAEPVAGPSKPKLEQISPKKVKEKPAKAAAPTGSSTFLPSLSAGFTLGESDAEDDYPLSEGEDAPVSDRKNRRGQRARRAIWEKKFGKNAKHLQQSAKAEQMAQAAVDAKQAARMKGRSNQQQQQQPWGQSRSDGSRDHSRQQSEWQHSSGDGQGAAGQKRKRDEAPAEEDASTLHPSWKARKLAKEKVSMALTGGASAGTKITFDD